MKVVPLLAQVGARGGPQLVARRLDALRDGQRHDAVGTCGPGKFAEFVGVLGSGAVSPVYAVQSKRAPAVEATAAAQSSLCCVKRARTRCGGDGGGAAHQPVPRQLIRVWVCSCPAAPDTVRAGRQGGKWAFSGQVGGPRRQVFVQVVRVGARVAFCAGALGEMEAEDVLGVVVPFLHPRWLGCSEGIRSEPRNCVFTTKGFDHKTEPRNCRALTTSQHAGLRAAALGSLTTQGYDQKTPFRTSFDQRFK